MQRASFTAVTAAGGCKEGRPFSRICLQPNMEFPAVLEVQGHRHNLDVGGGNVWLICG